MHVVIKMRKEKEEILVPFSSPTPY
jgi:hypothetical protein